jgi:cytochrome bd-type quinol oxidase subunit 1
LFFVDSPNLLVYRICQTVIVWLSQKLRHPKKGQKQTSESNPQQTQQAQCHALTCVAVREMANEHALPEQGALSILFTHHGQSNANGICQAPTKSRCPTLAVRHWLFSLVDFFGLFFVQFLCLHF